MLTSMPTISALRRLRFVLTLRRLRFVERLYRGVLSLEIPIQVCFSPHTDEISQLYLVEHHVYPPSSVYPPAHSAEDPKLKAILLWEHSYDLQTKPRWDVQGSFCASVLSAMRAAANWAWRLLEPLPEPTTSPLTRTSTVNTGS